jgi:hypothetical protein
MSNKTKSILQKQERKRRNGAVAGVHVDPPLDVYYDGTNHEFCLDASNNAFSWYKVAFCQQE